MHYNNRIIQREVIEIYGKIANGISFYLPFYIIYNPYEKSTEEALIEAFNSDAKDFDMLALEMGWEDSYWTYQNR